MKAIFGVLLALVAPWAVAQSLLPVAGNGQVLAPGAISTRVEFAAQPFTTVTFEPFCIDRVRGEAPPFPCVAAVAGESLTVVSDATGRVLSPLYQAEAVEGVAWILATVTAPDGRPLHTPFYMRVGASALEPIRIVAGHDQTVQGGFPAQTMLARIVDYRGRPVAGVPVAFVSPCAASGTPLPCLLEPDVPGRLVSDNQGYVDSGIRVANDLAGTYHVRLAIRGAAGGVDFRIMNVLPTRAAAVRTATGAEAFLRMVEAAATCSITRLQPLVDTLAPRAPDKLAFPQGLFELDIENCPPGATVAFSLQHPGAFPEGSRVWAVRPEWRALATVNPIEGFWEFSITDGGEGDADGLADGRIATVFAVAYGDPAAPDFQDLWWVGIQENGWGLSIVQHGDRLFVVIFAYDSSGQPTWYVMPGGSWDATRATYTGMIYSPRGRPLGEHLAADLVVGAPVGALALTFFDTMSARAVVTLGGSTTVKFIERQFFGVRDASVTGRYGDMWWAGASRNGWGLVLQQQYASMFAVLFTYGTDGRPTWFAMPSITRNQNEVFEGVAYRTTSSSWPAGYDPGRLESRDVGFFRVQFTNGTAAFDFTADGRSDRFTLSRMPF